MKIIPGTLLIFCAISASSRELPSEWQLAETNDLGKPALRQNSANAYTQVEADFNGDGMVDYAVVVKSTIYSGEALLVHLSSASGHQWQVLEKIHWGEDYPDVPLVMGIELAETGNYLTACGQGQWQCDEYETSAFAIEFPGIWYFRMGEHKALFYWNAEQQKFKKQWISN